jgi:hypothetical protein
MTKILNTPKIILGLLALKILLACELYQLNVKRLDHLGGNWWQCAMSSCNRFVPFSPKLLKRTNYFFLPAEPVGTPPVQGTEEDCIQKLTRQLKEANITITKLKEEKYSAELSKAKLEEKLLSKAKLEEKLQLTLSQLKCAREYLQRKGEVCQYNCVLSSLLWICHQKLKVHPCGRCLEKIIIIHAERNFGPIKKEYLRCDGTLCVLQKCKILDRILNIRYDSPDMKDDERDKKIREAWHTLMKVDVENLVLMVGRLISETNRHCVVCDLETRTKDDKLTYYDLQKDDWGEGNQEDFRRYVKTDEGIKLYTVNFKNLEQLIEKYTSILHKTSPTGTDCNCMFAPQNSLPVPPANMLPYAPEPATLDMLPEDDGVVDDQLSNIDTD